jgi:hypothetical protein
VEKTKKPPLYHMHMDVSLWEAKNQIGPFEANKVTKVTKLCQESSNDTYKLSF